MTAETPMTDDDPAQHATDDTESTFTDDSEVRHHLTNDGLAVVLTAGSLAMFGLASSGLLDLGLLPYEVLLAWMAAFVTAVGWTFGKDLLEAWAGDRG